MNQRPTQGERTQLDRTSSIYCALIGERLAPVDPVIYRLIERGTGRVKRQIAPEMAPGLLHAGWLEPSGACNLRRRGYCITLAGIRA